MPFITDIDYKAYIKDTFLDIISDSNIANRLKAESAAMEEMQSYLRMRHDVAKVFFNVRTWDGGVSYLINDHVIFNDIIYFAILDNTNQQPDTNPDDWTVGDQRNQVVVMYFVDLVIYHLHSSINPRNIPELRGIRYDAAIAWLKKVADAKLEPDLPKLEDDTGNLIRFNSNPKQRHIW